MRVSEKVKLSLMYDFYGQLLSEKQNDIFKLYHEENYTLSEIAEELKISRQGVHDALKKSESIFENFEDKLNLVEKHLSLKADINMIEPKLKKLADLLKEDDEASNCLKDINKKILELNV